MGYERNIMSRLLGTEVEDQKVLMDIQKSFYNDEDETVTFTLDSKDYFENDLIEKWIEEFIKQGVASKKELKERFAESPLNQFAELIIE